jgi:hypothetical protein
VAQQASGRGREPEPRAWAGVGVGVGVGGSGRGSGSERGREQERGARAKRFPGRDARPAGGHSDVPGPNFFQAAPKSKF